MECGPLSLTFSSVKRAQLTYNTNANKRANIANGKASRNAKLGYINVKHIILLLATTTTKDKTRPSKMEVYHR